MRAIPSFFLPSSSSSFLPPWENWPELGTAQTKHVFVLFHLSLVGLIWLDLLLFFFFIGYVLFGMALKVFYPLQFLIFEVPEVVKIMPWTYF